MSLTMRDDLYQHLSAAWWTENAVFVDKGRGLSKRHMQTGENESLVEHVLALTLE